MKLAIGFVRMLMPFLTKAVGNLLYNRLQEDFLDRTVFNYFLNSVNSVQSRRFSGKLFNRGAATEKDMFSHFLKVNHGWPR